MLKYTTQEMSINPNADGTRKQRYAVVSSGLVRHDQLLDSMCHPGSGIARATAEAALGHLAETLAQLLANGFTVQIKGVGTFRAGISEKKVKHTMQRGKIEAPTDKRPYAANLQLDRVIYKADPELIRDARSQCKLQPVHRQNYTPLSQIGTTLDERLSMLKGLLAERHFAHIHDYAKLAQLSESTARRELLRFADDPHSGIGTRGTGSGKVYVLTEG